MVKNLNGRKCWWLSGVGVSTPLPDGSIQETRIAFTHMESVNVNGDKLDVVEYKVGDVVLNEKDFDRIYEYCRDNSCDYTDLKRLLKREIFNG